MSRLVLCGGGELDAGTPAGRVLASCQRVAVVTLAAAFRRPEALRADIGAWAEALRVEHAVVAAVRRADSLDPATSAPVASADGVLVLDGSPAHLVGALKATPLLDAIVGSHCAGATVVWSGAAAAAVCDPMVDDRGGALTVGLGLYAGITAATGWDRWPRDRRRRLRRMLPSSVLFVALAWGAAVQSASARAVSTAISSAATRSEGEHLIPAEQQWTAVGGAIEAQRAGQPVILASTLQDQL